MKPKQLGLYARTLAGLQPVQWVYILIRGVQARLPPRVPKPFVQLTDGELVRAVETIGGAWTVGVMERAHAIVRGEFAFLGHTECLERIDWRGRHVNHLWSYNLHYFDYAHALAWAHRETGDAQFAEAFTELALSWVRGTDPGRGDGWEPYAVSLRLVNWLCALSLLQSAVPSVARNEIASSLGRQAAWLERRLEKHIQANHLQKNWLALSVAGLFFSGKAATRWRRKGLAGTWRAVREQVLDDGVHFERSPMYHAIALADFLKLIALCNAAGEPVPTDVAERVGRMVDALGALSRTDGSLHLFNDAANGIAPSRGHLDRLADRITGRRVPAPDTLIEFSEAGYYGWVRPDDGVRLLIDCGAPGPRHQPGHAHCDLLSFELEIGGQLVVVDSGVHGYDGDPYREYARSTRAHNTVMIGDREQSEMWGTFRVGRMARVRRAVQRSSGESYRFEGACSPYHAMKWQHARRIEVSEKAVQIFDQISAEAGVSVRSFLHLHPRFHIRSVEGVAAVAASEDGDVIQIRWAGADAVRAGRGASSPEGWYFPEFGRSVPAPVFEALATAGVDGEAYVSYEIRWS